MKNNEWLGFYILMGFAALMVFMHRRYEPVAIAIDDGKPDDFDPSIYRQDRRATKLPCPTECNGGGLNVAGSGSTLQIAKPGVIAHTPTVR